MSDNELIAEFMGGQRSQRGQDTVFYFTPDFRGSGFWHIDYIPFDRSWDWLMPVVEKIHSLDLPNVAIEIERFRTAFTTRGCTILFYYNKQCGSKIGATYKAVVEFIKWYNQNK